MDIHYLRANLKCSIIVALLWLSISISPSFNKKEKLLFREWIPRPVWNHKIEQGFSVLVLLTFWAREFFVGGGGGKCLEHWRMLSSISGLLPLDSSSHCLIPIITVKKSPGEKLPPPATPPPPPQVEHQWNRPIHKEVPGWASPNLIVYSLNP